MKLRNRKTGEIIERYIIETARAIGANLILQDNDTNKHYQYNSLAELNEEWEDAPEEPKEYWFIDYDGDILRDEFDSSSEKSAMMSIGNHFETKEEAEKAVEKFKAWKRLKDKGFRFEDRDKPNYGENFIIKCSLPKETLVIDVAADLDLLFGGEE